MSGQSMTAVVGGDWTRPLPAVEYTEPKAKPCGLDWSKHRAPEPVAPVVERPEATVTQIRQRVTTPRPRKPRPPRTGPRKTRISVVDVSVAAAEYRAGATCPEIADRHGWPVVSVRRQLARAGVQMRDDRAVNSGGRNAAEHHNPELVDRIRALYIDQGMSQREVATKLQVSPKVVRNVMKRHDIPARPGQNGGGNTLQGYNDRLADLAVTGATIRAWAVDQGLPIGVRGVIPNHILHAYEAAHPTQEGTS